MPRSRQSRVATSSGRGKLSPEVRSLGASSRWYSGSARPLDVWDGAAAFIVPDGYTDEQVLFLSDIFPTGYMAAENCDIKKGQTIAVFGCGPVGLFSIMSAFVLRAGRVIAVDTVKERMDLAHKLMGPAGRF